jgi:23S rRNA pseudouridine2605 synthase
MPQSRRRSSGSERTAGVVRGQVSLARALSKLGLCSRSEAMRAIDEGRVRLNGRVCNDHTRRVTPERDAIVIDGASAIAPTRSYVMLNKPRGVVTTRRDPGGRPTVFSCLADAGLPYLAPVGRLDQASEGLLLLTNDSQWAHGITAPESHMSKTYDVQIDRVPDQALIESLSAGVQDEEVGLLRAAEVRMLRAGARRGWLQIALDEGKNRQIRRMLAAHEVMVLRLVRVQIGRLALGELAKGAWRALTPVEIEGLRVPRTAVPRRKAD